MLKRRPSGFCFRFLARPCTYASDDAGRPAGASARRAAIDFDFRDTCVVGRVMRCGFGVVDFTFVSCFRNSIALKKVHVRGGSESSKVLSVLDVHQTLILLRCYSIKANSKFDKSYKNHVVVLNAACFKRSLLFIGFDFATSDFECKHIYIKQHFYGPDGSDSIEELSR